MAALEGSRCTCGRVTVPARRYCPDCQRRTAPAKVDAQGVVESHTTIHLPAEGFEAPLHIALVRLAPGQKGRPPVRVLARGNQPFADEQAVALAPEGDVIWAASG